MGNILVPQQKVIKITKTDGKILKYKAPMKVHQVLLEFPGHAISDNFPVLGRHLRPDTELRGDRLYHLVALNPLPSPEVGKKKKVSFANPEVESGKESGVVRIKLIISKQDLQEMLQKGETISVDDMVSQLQSKKVIDVGADLFDGESLCKGWKPHLESIPEV